MAEIIVRRREGLVSVQEDILRDNARAEVDVGCDSGINNRDRRIRAAKAIVEAE